MGPVAAAVAEFVKMPTPLASNATVIVTFVPPGTVLRSNTTVLPVALNVPRVVDAEANVASAGSVSVTVTPVRALV